VTDERLWKAVRCKRCDNLFMPEADKATDNEDGWLLRCYCEDCASPVEKLVVRTASPLQIAAYPFLEGREI